MLALPLPLPLPLPAPHPSRLAQPAADTLTGLQFSRESASLDAAGTQQQEHARQPPC